MVEGRIVVAGIGPGGKEDITPAVFNAIAASDVVIGYKYYFQFIADVVRPDALCVDTGMKRERERAEEAFRHAEAGRSVCVISSGDAGIYGMAPLIFEMKSERKSEVEVVALPGISAFQKAASLLGAPMGHDFCVISLSDLMTPWDTIERRIIAASQADFVTAIYNPLSNSRYWQLHRFKEIFLTHRSPDTPVGFVRQAGRNEQQVTLTNLGCFNPDEVDMFTVVIIGNSQTYSSNQRFMVTPRGYYTAVKEESEKVGQDIMIRSFRTIEGELLNRHIPLGRKWALLHAIHTTADFDMESILHVDDNAVETLHQAFASKRIGTVITDVTMVVSGVRKGALERMGIEVKCYLYDPRVAAMAQEKGITRTQAGIRLAVQEHPHALYAFGNAPTALMELCDLMRKGHAQPVGVIAAPVGFVNVRESKHMVKPFSNTLKLIVEGRKGGSNLAATLVNAILTFDDAAQLRPGRDL
ncbi:MAG: precorrin-3B C(17)-methyltransferase [Bacteroidales bacterium]|nr:precorrin-3B C(17)-methyltransferase [Bacteroidales bacterium]MBN2750976.1 precorrin-3B C(17)-methyltransferase [Bacteroidales bacterium]